MILGVGTDIVNINRINDLWQKFGEKFGEKFFTLGENSIACKYQENTSRKISFYAKRFAAKEAFAKACGIGIGRGINFCDIEVTNNDLGKPEISLINKKDVFLHNYLGQKNIKIHLSLSDEKPFAQAFVVIEKI